MLKYQKFKYRLQHRRVQGSKFLPGGRERVEKLAYRSRPEVETRPASRPLSRHRAGTEIAPACAVRCFLAALCISIDEDASGSAGLEEFGKDPLPDEPPSACSYCGEDAAVFGSLSSLPVDVAQRVCEARELKGRHPLHISEFEKAVNSQVSSLKPGLQPHTLAERLQPVSARRCCLQGPGPFGL